MNNKELLVMSVIVELWSKQSPGIVSDRSNLLVRIMNRHNASDGIVGGVCLHDDWSVWNSIGKDRSRDEGIFEILEGGATGVTEVPGNTFAGEVDQRSDDTRAVIYKSPIKVHKPKKRLHVLDLPRFRPVLWTSPSTGT